MIDGISSFGEMQERFCTFTNVVIIISCDGKIRQAILNFTNVDDMISTADLYIPFHISKYSCAKSDFFLQFWHKNDLFLCQKWVKLYSFGTRIIDFSVIKKIFFS